MEQQASGSRFAEECSRLVISSQIAFLNTMANSLAGGRSNIMEQQASGTALAEEFARLAIVSQVSFLDFMTGAFDSAAQSISADVCRDLNKAYARAAIQVTRSQSEVMKNFSSSLKEILRSMEEQPTPTPPQGPAPSSGSEH